MANKHYGGLMTTIRKAFIVSSLFGAFCVSCSNSVWADNSDTKAASAPDDKAGDKMNSQYDKQSSTETVPSGKRHRTHRKHGQKAENADAQKTIQAGDPTTPSK
jgi:hypothetical protein